MLCFGMGKSFPMMPRTPPAHPSQSIVKQSKGNERVRSALLDAVQWIGFVRRSHARSD